MRANSQEILCKIGSLHNLATALKPIESMYAILLQQFGELASYNLSLHPSDYSRTSPSPQPTSQFTSQLQSFFPVASECTLVRRYPLNCRWTFFSECDNSCASLEIARSLNNNCFLSSAEMLDTCDLSSVKHGNYCLRERTVPWRNETRWRSPSSLDERPWQTGNPSAVPESFDLSSHCD